MKMITFYILIAISTLFTGCVSNSQTFIGKNGDIKTCASTSQAQGLGGVVLAQSRFNNCVEDVKANGFKEIESVGSIGITLYPADANGLRVMKVYDNSPAAKAGIVRGDVIVAIDGKKALHKGDFESAQGEIGSPVTLTVKRDENERDVRLVKAKLKYSKFLEDVTYE